jgi:hypothetical protein
MMFFLLGYWSCVCRPDQDSLKIDWMENGNVENRHFEMQGASAEGCNAQQLSYASSWGVGQEIEDRRG